MGRDVEEVLSVASLEVQSPTKQEADTVPSGSPGEDGRS